MSDWIEIQDEFDKIPRSISDDEACKQLRNKYLKKLHELTGRNVVTYYSASGINEKDISAFMTLTRGLAHGDGLDLFLHTSGGSISTAESIISFLRQIYGKDIRAFVMHYAMSAGTMIVCACKEIIMGSQSSLGPVDPQMYIDGVSVPAYGIIEEFNQAKNDITLGPNARFAWKHILKKYQPGDIYKSEKAIEWAREIVTESLKNNMLKGKEDEARKIANILTDPSKMKVHERRLSRDQCKEFGLTIKDAFELLDLKPTIYAIHWANLLTLELLPTMKVIENHEGKSI